MRPRRSRATVGTLGVKCDRPDQTKGDCCLQCEEVPCWHLNIQKKKKNAPGGGFSSEAVLQIECRLGRVSDRTNPYSAEPKCLPCMDGRQRRVTGSECEYQLQVFILGSSLSWKQGVPGSQGGPYV